MSEAPQTCSQIAYPYLHPVIGIKKHVGDIPCGTTGCDSCYTLEITSNFEDVPIVVSPPDDAGLTNGQTPFLRSYFATPGVTVSLTAPPVFNGFAFKHWRIDETQLFQTLQVFVLMDGVCHKAHAIYGNTITFASCAGCVEIPQYITVSGSYRLYGPCEPPSCATSLKATSNGLWGALPHSAICGPVIIDNVTGAAGWGGFNPAQTPANCMPGAGQGDCGAARIAFRCCTFYDQPEPYTICWWESPCYAQFGAQLQCSCNQQDDSLYAIVGGSLGGIGRRWTDSLNDGEPCAPVSPDPVGFASIGSGQITETRKVATVLTPQDCCLKAPAVLGTYLLFFNNPHSPSEDPQCRKAGWVRFTI